MELEIFVLGPEQDLKWLQWRRPSLRKVEQLEGRFSVSPWPVATYIKPAPAVSIAQAPVVEYVEPATISIFTQQIPSVLYAQPVIRTLIRVASALHRNAIAGLD